MPAVWRFYSRESRRKRQSLIEFPQDARRINARTSRARLRGASQIVGYTQRVVCDSMRARMETAVRARAKNARVMKRATYASVVDNFAIATSSASEPTNGVPRYLMTCRCGARALTLLRLRTSPDSFAAPLSLSSADWIAGSGDDVASAREVTGFCATVNANPYPVSFAKIPATAVIGTATSCDAARHTSTTAAASSISRFKLACPTE